MKNAVKTPYQLYKNMKQFHRDKKETLRLLYIGKGAYSKGSDDFLEKVKD